MDTFSIVRGALERSATDPDKVGLDYKVTEAGRIIDAVQTVVDALTPPDGGRYVVRFANINTAGTSYGDRDVTVSSKPLNDPLLSIVEKAVVVATLTAHEIGHTLVSRPRKYPVNLINEHNAHSGYKSVTNICDDIILEPYMVERFPILADAFEFTALWVLRTTADHLPIRDVLNRASRPEDRFNIILHATRYGDIPQILWDDARAAEERDWAREWKGRLLACPLLDHAGFLALADEFWERVRTVDDTPEPEQPLPTPEPEEDEDADDDEQDEAEDDEQDDEPGGDEPGGEDGPEGEGPPSNKPGTEKSEEPRKGDDFDMDDDDEQDDDGGDQATDGGDEPTETEGEDDESEDGDGDGSDGDGEDGDDDGGDTGDGDSEDGDGEDGEDGDDKGKGEGGDEAGENPVEHGDFDGHDGTDGADQNADGGGGNAEANADSVRPEDEFDDTLVDKTTHDQVTTTPWDQREDVDFEQKVRTYNATTVTRFGIHGTMSTTWE